MIETGTTPEKLLEFLKKKNIPCTIQTIQNWKEGRVSLEKASHEKVMAIAEFFNISEAALLSEFDIVIRN
jgi:transcriptional regulator with XRE-family HTH domain